MLLLFLLKNRPRSEDGFKNAFTLYWKVSNGM